MTMLLFLLWCFAAGTDNLPVISGKILRFLPGKNEEKISFGKAIVEMDPNGNLLGVSSLPKSVHKKPEGVVIAPDRTMVICNEGGGKDKTGRIVVYPLL